MATSRAGELTDMFQEFAIRQGWSTVRNTTTTSFVIEVDGTRHDISTTGFTIEIDGVKYDISVNRRDAMPTLDHKGTDVYRAYKTGGKHCDKCQGPCSMPLIHFTDVIA